jgi:cobalt-zinc-cadmium efflux system outer membrane protein
MRHIGVLLLTMTVLFASTSRARDREDVVSLSLQGAVARAEARSPLVQRATGERRVIESLRVGAGIALPSNPFLSFGAGRRFDRSGSQPTAEGFEWGLHLEQAFEIGGQRSARLDEVARAGTAAVARERWSRIEARALVRGAYIGALLFRSQVDAARKRVELAAQVLESARSRVAAGAASDVDVNLAESERGRAVHERIEAEIQVANEEAELRRLLDYPPDTPLILVTPLSLPPETESEARLLEAARRRREDLRALAAERSQLDATLTRLRREIVPSPTLFADFAQQRPGQTYVGGGVGIPLPLFRRNQGPIATADAERARLDTDIRIAQNEMDAEVVRMRRGLSQRREEARVWAEEVVPAADENLKLVTEGFRAGKFDLFRVVQAARDAADARRRQLEVIASLWQVAIDLDRATGAP